MPKTQIFTLQTLPRDLTAGLTVFLVALPLCLGIALASGAPLFSGIVAGAVGGIVVGLLSGSHTSVSGPAAGLTSVVLLQIAAFKSFETFLCVLVVAGLIQIVLGLAKAGFITAFFPSSVVKGLLAAIGVILVLKQIPHLLGHDTSPQGEMAFSQFDNENTFSEFGELLYDIHPGATIIGLVSLALMILWERSARLRNSVIPAPLIIVFVGIALNLFFQRFAGGLMVDGNHLVQVPVARSFAEFLGFLKLPNFAALSNPLVYQSALMLALVASLETLLNLEAVDKLDRRKRTSPPSRELLAQGVGNMLCGFLGGIPVTVVIARSSVNVDSGGQTKLAAIFQGVLLFVCVMLMPRGLNLIPISCLAAILLVTGVKLASPRVMVGLWKQGPLQFIPFVVTVLAIVFTDLSKGILIGLAVSISFILSSNFRRPMRRIVEKHPSGDVLRIELANQVTFLNRAALQQILNSQPRGSRVLLDAQHTDYIDPDVLDMLREYKDQIGPTRGVEVSVLGFREKYQLEDEIQYVDHSTRELQSALTPAQVLKILKDGHERFRTGKRLGRDLGRQVAATATGQHPLAVVLSCIDSRAPAELVFDTGVGDIFSVRLAGNVISPKALGSMEYACAVAGAKLLLVMGHTRCGAVSTAVKLANSTEPVAITTGCENVEPILVDIQESINREEFARIDQASALEMERFINEVAALNVLRSTNLIVEQSSTLRNLALEGRIAIVGAIYDVVTGDMQYLTEDAVHVMVAAG